MTEQNQVRTEKILMGVLSVVFSLLITIAMSLGSWSLYLGFQHEGRLASIEGNMVTRDMADVASRQRSGELRDMANDISEIKQSIARMEGRVQ